MKAKATKLLPRTAVDRVHGTPRDGGREGEAQETEGRGT